MKYAQDAATLPDHNLLACQAREVFRSKERLEHQLNTFRPLQRAYAVGLGEHLNLLMSMHDFPVALCKSKGKVA